jgi:hypothetical protein
MIPVDSVSARATVLTRCRCTLVYVHTTILSSEARQASAFVVVVQHEALAAVGAWFRKAEVHAGLATRAHEPRRALTPSVIHHVHAGTSVFADYSGAVVDVDFAAVAFKSGFAGAAVSVASSGARGAVSARISCTGVRF